MSRPAPALSHLRQMLYRIHDLKELAGEPMHEGPHPSRISPIAAGMRRATTQEERRITTAAYTVRDEPR